MKRFPASYSGVAEVVVGRHQLGWLLEEADAAVSFLPSSAETRRLLGAEELARLGGWLVNVGRGDTVDEEGLVEAISSGRLAGAALDVTDTEPLPADSPLWGLEGVIITPHMAWITPHLPSRLVDLIAINVDAWLAGEDPPTRVA
jgi:phosphoglycerate dehydrogenase-like enzyme